MFCSSAWTRRHIFRDIPEDVLVHVDIPNCHGWKRHWFAVIPFGDRIVEFPVLTQSFLTTPTNSQQTTTAGVDATWNNSNNKIESLGAGGSGGADYGAASHVTGGGGGAYAKAVNFNIANPGVTTFGWTLGAGGPGATATGAGTAGGNTWFNNTAFATGTSNAQCNAAGGGAGQEGASTVTVVGGTAGTTGFGNTINAGGAGGACNATANRVATGGGGAGGPNGIGNTAPAVAAGSAGGAGGSGDAGSGGAAGTAGTSASGGPGGTATEFDASHGCGGGGGGGENSSSSQVNGGAGGLYGGGGGGGQNNVSVAGQASGAGAQGIIVLTWTPGAATKHPNLLPLLGAGMIVSSQFDRRQLMKMIALLRGIRL